PLRPQPDRNRSESRAPAVSQVAASRKNTVPSLAPRSLQNLTGQNAERHDTTLGYNFDTVEVLGSVRALGFGRLPRAGKRVGSFGWLRWKMDHESMSMWLASSV